MKLREAQDQFETESGRKTPTRGAKTPVIALLVLLGLGGAAYWLQQTGLLAQYWPAVATLTAQRPAQPAPQAAGGNRRATPVEVAAAAQATLSDNLTAIGTLLADESVDIAAETSGRIAEILFKDGENVAAGAVLFRLDDDLVSAQIADAKARLGLAEANFRRNSTLRKSGNVSQSVLDAAIAELEQARAAVELANVQLDQLSITAPFAATAGFRSVSLGAYVNAGTPLVHLEKTDRLKVAFSVPELEIGRLALGDKVAFVADALPGETFVATISAIDPSLDVNGRALKVRADLDNAEGRLRPGLLVRVTVSGPPRNTVTVPEAAIVPRGDGAIVYLAENNKAREAKVRIGKRAQGTVEIIAGIEAGAQVVVAGNTRLSNGADIEIVSGTASN
jgi:membrane fusion protein (multidrug efflux system)